MLSRLISQRRNSFFAFILLGKLCNADDVPWKKIVDEIQYGREIAGLAYKHSPEKEEKYLREFPRMKNLIDRKTFTGKTGIHNDVITPCGFVAKNPENGELIIAIRGTNGVFARTDWFTNFKMYQLSSDHLTLLWDDDEEKQERSNTIRVDLSQMTQTEKKVHAGFYRYAHSMIDSIWGGIFQRLKKDFEESKDADFGEFLQKAKISIYGHSLGGAASQIIALMIKNELLHQMEELSNAKIDIKMTAEKIKGNIRVFTYESPRVFNPDLANDFDDMIGAKNHIRIVQKSKVKYEKSFFLESASEFFHAAHKSAIDFLELEEDGLALEKSEWVVDPATLAPLGNFKETGTLCEIIIEKEADRLKAGPVLHDMIPKINAGHIKECLQNLK